MWMMTPRGFFSAVQHREHPALMLVRARSREDLENLCELGEGHPGMIGVKRDSIIETKISDYPYRLIISARAWQMLTSLMAEEITYPNFKSAVHAVNHERASTYMDVWSALHRIEGERPKTMWDKFRERFPTRKDEQEYLSRQVDLLLDDIADESDVKHELENRSRPIEGSEGGDFYDSLARAIEQIEVYDQDEDVDIYDPDPEESDERP